MRREALRRLLEGHIRRLEEGPAHLSLLHRAYVVKRAFKGHREDLRAEPQDCLRVAPARVCDRGRLRAGPQARPVQAKAVHRRGHRRLQARARHRVRQAFPRIRDSLRSHIAKGSTVVGDMEKVAQVPGQGGRRCARGLQGTRQ